MNVNLVWPTTGLAHPSSEPPRGRARALINLGVLTALG